MPSAVPNSVQSLQRHLETTSRLNSLGVCDRCLVRIAGEKYPPTLREAASLLDHHLYSPPPDLVDSPDGPKRSLVRPVENLTVCPSCCGLLQEDFCNVAFLGEICDRVQKSGYTMQTFWCSLTLPSAADVRARSFEEYWDETSFKISGRLSVKDAWKAVVTPVFTSAFNVRWTGREGLEINIVIENLEMDGKECDVLKKRYSYAFQEKRNPDGKLKRCITRHALEKVLLGMSTYDFKQYFPFPPKTISSPSQLVQINCVPSSVFVAGRYLKYSRTVSQTPWIIGEERKGDTSVEELISAKIQATFQADSTRFSASGREDIDVRMLGTGRPFGVELVNAKIAWLGEIDTINLEEDINNSCERRIAVNSLRIVSRSDMAILKAGEEEKTKTYSALCSAREAFTSQDLAKINGLGTVKTNQQTPVRVLHRRSNAMRPKVIHELRAEATENPLQFRLELKTQAGTYVKEFIHSDFGRTDPSISAILGRDVDCVELDVTGIDLVWPPSKS